MSECYIVQEDDGVSRFILEDGTGFLLLESCEEPPVVGDYFPMGDKNPPLIVDSWGRPLVRGNRRRRDDEIIGVVLGEL